MWGIVFGLAAMLTLAVLMAPVAKRSSIPYTVLLALLGVALGFLFQYLGAGGDEAGHAVGGGHDAGGGQPHHADDDDAGYGGGHGGGSILNQMISAIGGLRITSDVILFLFLPALVFESALSLDLRKLLADIRSILFLAVVGVLISTAIVGLTLFHAAGMALVVCLLLGAIVSATDPVAVIALFKDLNAPKRLTVLVEGESLFNDATAIVASSILLGMLTSQADADLVAGLGEFLVVFLGGIVVGVLIARPACSLMGAFSRDPLIILTLTISLPFLTFVIAEHFLHVSGVMAVVAAGLTVGSVGRRLIPPQDFVEVEHAWHQLAFWATSLIFLLVGLATPDLLGEDGALFRNVIEYWDEVLILIAAATLARILIIFGFLPLMSRFAGGQAVSTAYKSIMVWGGLRGAVSLALALIVLENAAVSEEARTFIGVLVTSFVLFTLLFQATTIRFLMALFGLDRLSARDQALRDRSLSRALESVKAGLARAAAFSEIGAEEAAPILNRYDRAIEEARARAARADSVSVDDWMRIGLAMALAQERQIYLAKFGEGFASSRQLRDVLGRLDDVSDALKAPALDWPAAIERGVAFRRQFKFALYLQRRTGWSFLLARSLARRFGVLHFMREALRAQRETGIEEIAGTLPAEARDAFRALADERYAAVVKNHEALALQYPDYAAALKRRNLSLAGLRLEEQAYDRLRDQAVIGPEIHNDLMKRISGAEARVAKLPLLRLRFDPLALVGKVPFFAELSRRRQRRIARLLRSKFVPPGEVFVRRGEIGEEMYFIASGAVRVWLENGETVDLGTGDFVGELALVTNNPRNADVESIGFSTLLVLHRNDFKTFVRKNPDITEHIRKIAIERLGEGAQIDI